MNQILKRKAFSSYLIIIYGFLGAILIGTLLLMLPFSSQEPGGAGFLDALFTSVSAVCVCGLVVRDTASCWTLFGQFMIILLIQVGGLGIVTMTVIGTMLSGRRIGLFQRSLMQKAIDAPSMGGIVRLTRFIFKVAFISELIGAVLMAPVFCRDFGLWKGLWYALFHSVSAFCNAGFDLMGVKSPNSSLMYYSGNALINLVIMAEIIFGGIGFLTWDDIHQHGIHLKKYRLQSKVILIMTGLLIVVPALYFFFIEFASPVWRWDSVGEKVLTAMFTSVTARTAGYSTLDFHLVSEPGLLLFIVLMMIGAAPGSTGGGMKVTTVMVLIASMVAIFRNREETECFGRRIGTETVRHAAAVFTLYIGLFLAGSFTISLVEGLPIIECLFETASAINTVGVSLGHTYVIGTSSKIILMVLMFFGRVGGLTMIYAVASARPASLSKLPQEQITVG